jgi:molecular chaperone GrpE
MSKRKDDTKHDKPSESLPVDVGPEAEAVPVDPPVSAPPAPESPLPTPEQLEAARLADRLLRLQADFENFRKRAAREREDLRKYGGEAVLLDLIPVLDHVDFGLQQAHAKTGGESFAEGLRLIQSQLMEALRKHGLEAIDAVGCEFDAKLHEAMAMAPSDKVPEGWVIAQTRRGYKLGDRLLRPATVLVSSGAGLHSASRPEGEG